MCNKNKQKFRVYFAGACSVVSCDIIITVIMALPRWSGSLEKGVVVWKTNF